MPILHIRALPQKDPSRVQPALKKTCVAIAEAYGCKSEQVWATWEEIKSGLYVEGENPADTQPSDSHPPVAQLTCFEGKSAVEIENILTAAASTLSESLGIPNNIFMTYHEAKSRQVVAGNGIVRKKL
jgi:hypothetical protein